MAEIILHHYPLSPFAEKIRRILAYKRVPWRSVEQPIMAPKPELAPLTGGYRRIPVLQIGADVYCDSACIARRLEQLRPEPACIPEGLAGVAGALEDWADHRLFLLQTMRPAVVAMLPALPPDILADRAAMSPALSKEALVKAAPHALSQALLSLDRLDRQLRGRPFLLGEAFSIADAACFHAVWFLRNSADLFAAVAARPALAAWFARIEGFGPGDVRPMSAADALEIARTSEPADVTGGGPATAAGVSLGDVVAIAADDYGPEESRGVVVRFTEEEIAIRRRDAALGDIAVHFPRAGYRIEKR
ncbi:glutathione S-transferase [Sorangium cellulosum]|uniref:Glutathione S-transferase n=1 Tax=Sorangium cellulosum TaxID=56 RepID=A0A2L0ET54_SORCE|nr:glutathione S-transferase family protein [Sorangium cellulosum]AUX42463.1 glutathione S-transferase [Sorangium cellulosum]